MRVFQDAWNVLSTSESCFLAGNTSKVRSRKKQLVYIYIYIYIYIYAMQDHFLAWFNRFEFRIFVLPEQLLYQEDKLFTHSCKENNCIHTLLKVIIVIWTVKRLVQDLNSCCRVYYPRWYLLHQERLYIYLSISRNTKLFKRINYPGIL